VIDGNFTADHLKMKHPENDICLTLGSRYMVEPTRYESHLHEVPDYREVGFLLNKQEMDVNYASEIHMLRSQGSQQS